MKNNNIMQRLANLLTVKSIVTLTLTIVFAVLSLTGQISSEMFIGIFSTCIAFYFGLSKRDDTANDK